MLWHVEGWLMVVWFNFFFFFWLIDSWGLVREFSNKEATLSAKAFGFHVVQEKPESWEYGRGWRTKGLLVVPAFLHLSREDPKPEAGQPPRSTERNIPCWGPRRIYKRGAWVVQIKDLQARKTCTPWTWGSFGKAAGKKWCWLWKRENSKYYNQIIDILSEDALLCSNSVFLFCHILIYIFLTDASKMLILTTSVTNSKHAVG